MVRFLNNEDIGSVFGMKECIEALEAGMKEFAMKKMALRPKIQVCVPLRNKHEFYRWSSVEGASRDQGTFAVRIMSDIMSTKMRNGVKTHDQYCVTPGKYCGLIWLFSINTGAPLAIIHDGLIQQMSAGGTAGLGVKYLARKDSEVVGLIGSGGMARMYCEAFSTVRPIKCVRVFSPTRNHREEFGRSMSRKLGVDVVAVDDPSKAASRCDILASCTNSDSPVIRAAWLKEGMHLTNITEDEIDENVTAKANLIVKTANPSLFPGLNQMNVRAGGLVIVPDDTPELLDEVPGKPFTVHRTSEVRTLSDIIYNTKLRRSNDKQITFFSNTGGPALRFTSIAGRAYDLADKQNLGKVIPTDWFLESIKD